ncbi:uncharacterized protein LOC131635130 [Vicia villosa]|uniref:uncharacterized protein LOC131635130 n=1 Tax=Vicia villosa TaxID=3911 RepID=UPI00273B58A8|nr:uncharacterized protein LOC131635130 [Vicia villosa]
MILTEYDIQYTTQKAIKSSVIADYLAHQPVDDYQTMHFEFPDEDIMCVVETANSQDQEEGPEPGARWTLVFDGASNALGNGIGAVLTSPTDFHIPFTARICFDCTNNVAEYEACIYGIEAAIDLRIKNIAVYGDSALVKWDNEAPSIVIKRLDEPAFCGVIDNVPDEKPWFYDIKKFLETQEYPEGASLTDRKTLKRLSAKFFLAGGATPFSLVYGMEAILPVEVEIPSLRVLTDVKLSEADWVQTRFDQLNLIDEKRLAAICHGQAYQKKMKKAFDK